MYILAHVYHWISYCFHLLEFQDVGILLCSFLILFTLLVIPCSDSNVRLFCQGDLYPAIKLVYVLKISEQILLQTT